MSQHVEETGVFPKGADIKHHQTPPLWYTTMALGSVAYIFLVKSSILSMNRGVSLPASTTRVFCFWNRSDQPHPTNETVDAPVNPQKHISHGSCLSERCVPSNNNIADKQSRHGSQKQTVPDIPRSTFSFEGTIVCPFNHLQ